MKFATDLYASCSSPQPTATKEMWAYFSYGNSSVRIETTPRKLLDAVMDVDNNFISLQHFMARSSTWTLVSSTVSSATLTTRSTWARMVYEWRCP
jgi:hypothetical protein